MSSNYFLENGDPVLSIVNTNYILCFGTNFWCLLEDIVAGYHLVPSQGVKVELSGHYFQHFYLDA